MVVYLVNKGGHVRTCSLMVKIIMMNMSVVEFKVFLKHDRRCAEGNKHYRAGPISEVRSEFFLRNILLDNIVCEEKEEGGR